MKKFLTLSLLALACSAYAKYNFLFICVDDLRPELNCYGQSHIISPNIDKLASQGRVFKNHYVQVPTCGASRASMLTSQYPRIDDALDNSYAAKYFSDKPESEIPESFPHLLRRNGYYTVSIGKVSHTYDGYVDSKKQKPEYPYSWDERHLDKGKWDNAQKAYEKFDEGQSKQKHKSAPYECASNKVQFPDELNTNLAIKKLDELKAKDKPFMLAIGYFKPHLPFTSAKRYWDLYDEETLALAPQLDFGDIPAEFGHKSGEFNTYSFGATVSQTELMPEALAKKMRHAYYACVSATDEQIGRLLSALEEKGLAENTIIILWGDHGWHLGDNAMWGKHSLFKRALNSPLIISVPNMPQAGISTESIAESVDIYPTICELAQIEAPASIDGKSLSPIINNPKSEIKDYAISFWKKDPQIALHSKTEAFINMLGDKESVAYFDLSKGEQSASIAKQNPERVQALSLEIRNFLKAQNITFPFPVEPKKSSKKNDSKKDSEKSKSKDKDSSKEKSKSKEKSSKRDGKKDK